MTTCLIKIFIKAGSGDDSRLHTIFLFQNFLNVFPVDRIPTMNSLKTQADLTSAVYGIYAAQRFYINMNSTL